MSALTLAADLIRKHEGLRLAVYDDDDGKPIIKGSVVKGHPSIGYGRNLAARGISQEEAEELLGQDLSDAYYAASRVIDPAHFGVLCEARKAVLIDMAFNLGETGLRGFMQMRTAILRGDFDRAADEMLASKWARQVGPRATTLAAIMRTGEMAEERAT